MITHSITPYKTKYLPIPPPPTASVPNFQLTYAKTEVHRLGKLAYNIFLQNIPHKKGDLVIHKGLAKNFTDGNGFKLTPGTIFVVKDIQEIHQQADYDVSGQPKCLYLHNCYNSNFWADPNSYVAATLDMVGTSGVLLTDLL